MPKKTAALTPVQTAAYITRQCGLPSPMHVQQVWKLARKGILPHVRLGRRMYFRPEALDDFIAKGGGGCRIGYDEVCRA